MSSTYKFNVKMTCGGCSGAVTRALKKAEESGEVTKYTVDLESQEVIVESASSLEVVRARIAKTGKEIISEEVVG